MDAKKAHAKKADELINVLATEMKKTVRRLLASGAIKIEDYRPEEYALARIIVTVAMEQHTADYYPLHNKAYQKEIRNLKCF